MEQFEGVLSDPGASTNIENGVATVDIRGVCSMHVHACACMCMHVHACACIIIQVCMEETLTDPELSQGGVLLEHTHFNQTTPIFIV